MALRRTVTGHGWLRPSALGHYYRDLRPALSVWIACIVLRRSYCAASFPLEASRQNTRACFASIRGERFSWLAFM